MAAGEWRAAAAQHGGEVLALVRAGVEDGELSGAHPVFNFLRHYYGVVGVKALRKQILVSHRD